jgi:hypothetical protein
LLERWGTCRTPSTLVVSRQIRLWNEPKKYFPFNSWDSHLHDHAKITFIHQIITAQCHVNVGLPLFWDIVSGFEAIFNNWIVGWCLQWLILLLGWTSWRFSTETFLGSCI